MYQKGYVLVRIHDVAYEAPDENGNVRFVKGSVMLPEGKKPFVMSQDDVCYYPYMDGDRVCQTGRDWRGRKAHLRDGHGRRHHLHGFL